MTQGENAHREHLDRLARLHGLHDAYFDIWGKPHPLSESTRRGLLSAMGLPVDDPEAVAGAVEESLLRPLERPLPPVVVLRRGDASPSIPLTLPFEAELDGLSFLLALEDGTELRGALPLPTAPDAQQAIQHEGRRWHRLAMPLPGAEALPDGYHALRVLRSDGELLGETTLILSPRRCYHPPELENDGRLWGLCAQLYSVPSKHNWGSGDFGDLRQLVEMASKWGASFIGLNPLHALYPHNPAHESPYCPSSRLFFNIGYIDLAACPEYMECETVRLEAESPETVAHLESLRAAPLVDYLGIATLKRPLLERLFAHFYQTHLASRDERGRAFLAFVARQGEPLRLHALYEALAEHFSTQDPLRYWGWPAWPEAYRTPSSAEVSAFAEAHGERVCFFQYMQWLCDEQLAAVQRRALELGVKPGLYLDLSVSVDRAGAEVWADQGLYALHASVGAPPDALGPNGQDWGLPPMVPERLRERAYRPFVLTLRQNMRHAGALRLDHVMGLMRLFWIPPGGTAAEGAYVTYPLDDLLGILALESQRHRCLVIGEDLGTVPDEVRAALQDRGVLSYRLFIFERGEGGHFKRPEHYPRQALVTVTTHDLPTLGAFWDGYDLALRRRLGLFPSDDLRAWMEQERSLDRGRLLEALRACGLLPDGVSLDPAHSPRLSPALARAVQVYLARTPSQLLVVQLEDLLAQSSQANLPGTVREHPNWKQKLHRSLEDLVADREVQATALALSAERPRNR